MTEREIKGKTIRFLTSMTDPMRWPGKEIADLYSYRWGALHKACPIKISKLLMDNGKEFTDRLFASREREPSGNHEFDQLCKELSIEHRLTRPRTPKTNGMVERFNGRIADVLKTHRFNNSEDLEQTLMRYTALYNHQLPQTVLKSKTPLQTMKQWHQSHLFHRRPYDRPKRTLFCRSLDMIFSGGGCS
ncbi:putative integrase [Pectobacterium atrosepticum SCRI1043]|uniref:Integrase n=1 Tax=Pectobacterium atrosepticum (strain SCRI 1043 / ATCC BAA-672) TaxID=218491 RepID=Q6D541_PECAS|nr:hypothetical protein EV46_10540 [Pectobacterium atrosepticum]KMK88005.1 putative integrase [Pectobacterium atrosepticum ICMP 1526]CAG75102.1 putative integrase [Pectobacterium atrosepticum SCRI1043]GKV83720.1 hypothetical protein PEC301296_00320 [Pectobacterium carotovorum subsp. carotovorum]AIK14166.1 putative integrase [Pectobacterium atrosepticum]